jgi:HlyD family secretion protein
MKKIWTTGCIAVLLAACNGNGSDFDASGTFEAEEVIVSAEATGRILSLHIEEGMAVPKDSIIGTIDAENIALQKEQVEASIEALTEKTADVSPQVRLLQGQWEVQRSRLDNLLHERTRTENLVKADAATQKQLDDINAQIDIVQKEMNVTQQQINVQRSNTGTQNRSILSESKPMSKRAEQLNEQLQKASIVNPVAGTVLTQYAEQGEVVSAGKALYKIADLSTLILRAYISGSQLPQVKLGQQVKVLVDDGKKNYRELPGTITWIADKAEFTPKTIQTKEERANLVYAVKIKVKNDGYLKIGMYGEVKFK